jgi:hypothetical protein
MSLVRWVFAAAVVVAGCEGAAPVHSGSGIDAAPRPDSAPGQPDAAPDIDAPVVPTPDAPPGAPDARPAADAGAIDATGTGTACTSADGTMSGTCIDTSTTTCPGTLVSGRCPGPAAVKCCLTAMMSTPSCDPTIMPTPNDGLAEAAGMGGCPAGMIMIPDSNQPFCIDRYEASLVRTDDGSSWSPFFNPGTTSVKAVSLGGAVPQGYISGDQASAACTAAGKRLCADTEWLRACRGMDNYTYPYGNTRETGVCNDHRDEHPAVELFGSVTMLDSPCINQLHDTVDLTGSRTGCITEDGAYDMMGNLHEWTADSAGTFRGGFYVDTVINGNGCLYVTTAHNSAYWDYSTGFRCCADL